MITISLKGISKIYKSKESKTEALKNIDLDIYENDFIAIMGPSGCGKSTMLNLIGLIDKPTSGSYFYNTKDVSNLNDKEASNIRNEKISFIHQNFALIKELTVIENVMLPLKIRKISKSMKVQLAEKYLKEVGLVDVFKKILMSYLGGNNKG